MQSSNGYSLFVRQQPIASRACGSADRPDRRPIDPIVIVQLSHENYAQLFADGERATFFCVATLIEEPEKLEDGNGGLIQWQPVSSNLLTGTILSSIFYLKDPAKSSQTGAFFVFCDLNIRSEGTYKLRFDVFRMHEQAVTPMANCISTYFTVFSAKRFPGMTNSTELSKTFSDQGLKIRIRKDIRVRKKPRTGRQAAVETTSSVRGSSSPETLAESQPSETTNKQESAATRPLSPYQGRPFSSLNRAYPTEVEKRPEKDPNLLPKQQVTEVIHHHHHHHFQNAYNHDFNGYFSDLTPRTTPQQISLGRLPMDDRTRFEHHSPIAFAPRQHFPAGRIENNPQQADPPVRSQPRSVVRKSAATDQAVWREQMEAPSERTQPYPRPLAASQYSRPQSSNQAQTLTPRSSGASRTDDSHNHRLPSFGEAFAAYDAPIARSQEAFLPPGKTYPGSFPNPPRQL